MPHEHEHDRLPFLAEPGGVTRRCGEPSASDRDPAQPAHPECAGETANGVGYPGSESDGERPVRGNGTRRHVLSHTAVELVAQRFRILAEPLRVRIIQVLQEGERSVNDVAAAVGASQPNVSKHLRIIQNAGIAGRRQVGNQVYYFIADESVVDLCNAVCNSLGDKLEHDASLAEELQEGITRK